MGRSKLVLNDGSHIFFSVNAQQQSCSFNDGGSNNQCAEILVDVNGEKGPNKIGRDFFYFVIKENGLFPHSCDDEGYCNGPKSVGGIGCACKVIRENAMNY